MIQKMIHGGITTPYRAEKVAVLMVRNFILKVRQSQPIQWQSMYYQNISAILVIKRRKSKSKVEVKPWDTLFASGEIRQIASVEKRQFGSAEIRQFESIEKSQS